MSFFSFKAGDTIYVTNQDGEWWHGTLSNGKSGIFPASFIEAGSDNVSLMTHQ